MQLFMLTITARGRRPLTKLEHDLADKDPEIRDESDMTVRTRVVHMGFLMASSEREAEKRAKAMCAALERARRTEEEPPFSVEFGEDEHTFQAEVAGEGDLIRIGEFDD